MLLHIVMATLQTSVDVLQGLRYGFLIFKLEGHLLHLASQLHEVSMRFNVRFLLFFVPVDPDFASVLLSRNQLRLLVYFVQQLSPLNVILFFERFLFDF